MKFAKKKRVQDKDLIDALRLVGCVICDERPNDVHHVTTKGAGGHDKLDNLCPLCRHHHSLIHQMGVRWMANRYEAFKDWLKAYDRLDLLEGFETDDQLH